MTRRNGFTLAELLIYVTILIGLSLVFTNFMVDVTRSSARSRAAEAVAENARLVAGRITQAVRSAVAVQPTPSSVFDDDHGTLALTTASGSTIIRWQSDAAEIDGQALTSSTVRVPQLRFSSVGRAVTVTLTVEDASAAALAGTPSTQLTFSVVPRPLLY